MTLSHQHLCILCRTPSHCINTVILLSSEEKEVSYIGPSHTPGWCCLLWQSVGEERELWYFTMLQVVVWSVGGRNKLHRSCEQTPHIISVTDRKSLSILIQTFCECICVCLWQLVKLVPQLCRGYTWNKIILKCNTEIISATLNMLENIHELQ